MLRLYTCSLSLVSVRGSGGGEGRELGGGQAEGGGGDAGELRGFIGCITRPSPLMF